jgi:hypothetical protein
LKALKVFEKVFEQTLEAVMKNKMLQISLLLALTVISVATSAQAQIMTSYKAEIPFDFNFGNKTYRAGKYVIETRHKSTIVEWTLSETQRRELKRGIFLMNGEVSRGGTTNFIFVRLGDRYFLTKMTTPTYGLQISKSNIRQELVKSAERQNLQKETVAIALTKTDKAIE